jgi:hypothetical protein
MKASLWLCPIMSVAADLSDRLAQQAEAVCRAYLSRGRREGVWWTVGDVFNTPGRSLYVRLQGQRAGHWTDSATGEHGDLLDLIGRNRSLDLPAALDAARAFLALPHPVSQPGPVPSGSSESARRLFQRGCPIPGTLAESYLRVRGLLGRLDWPSLRFHPAVWYRPHADAPREFWPALLAAVTDGDGIITGLQRTYLDPSGLGKAPLTDPRRALGSLLGNGVRFGIATDVLAAGEGIETVLALKSVLPDLPMIAALSANHLAALLFAPALARLYVARDNDAAGRMAVERLTARGHMAGVEVRPLVPWADDFNTDLRRFGLERMRQRLAGQLAPEDAQRFLVRRDAG